MNKQTITINGKTYDKHTGLPVTVETTQPKKISQHGTPSHSSAIHQRQQKSTTLNRRYVKKTTTPSRPKNVADIQPAHTPVRTSPSPTITRFATTEKTTTRPTQATSLDIKPTRHPIHENAKRIQQQQAAPTAIKPSHVMKKEAEAKALAEATAHEQTTHKASRKERSVHSRRLGLAAAGAALILLGGYFTYISMPSISTRVAAAQAGIEATYPSYKPSGYSLVGPVAYSNGQVRMRFAMNGGYSAYDLNQERSSWDSTAVLQNYVIPEVGDSYMITNVGGLTIYTYDNSAAWVSGGILYTIDGDAPLSSEQIQKIATSL
jgi:hypothetical protein